MWLVSPQEEGEPRSGPEGPPWGSAPLSEGRNNPWVQTHCRHHSTCPVTSVDSTFKTGARAGHPASPPAASWYLSVVKGTAAFERSALVTALHRTFPHHPRSPREGLGAWEGTAGTPPTSQASFPGLSIFMFTTPHPSPAPCSPAQPYTGESPGRRGSTRGAPHTRASPKQGE